MYFVRNLTDDKLEIYFSREEYKTMPSEKQDFIKRSCLFSGRLSCWRSRAKLYSCGRVISWLVANGFEDKGEKGEKLSFADQVQREQEKAAERADRFTDLKEKAEKESQSRFGVANNIASCIPPGQPILVGHHSEKRHRRDIARIDSNMSKGVEAMEKAGYYGDRLKLALRTAEGSKYKSPRYLQNRIKETTASIRDLERKLQGKMYAYSQPREISETEREFWSGRLAEETDKLEYLQYCMSQCAGVFDKVTLEGKEYVKIRGRWNKVVRLNTKTVSVMNDIFETEELQKKYALKYNYGEVQEAK